MATKCPRYGFGRPAFLVAGLLARHLPIASTWKPIWMSASWSRRSRPSKMKAGLSMLS